MIKLLVLVAFLVIVGFGRTYGQSDSMNTVKTKYYQSQAETDGLTAAQITTIIDSYKDKVKAVIKNKGFSESQKKTKIEQLIALQTSNLKKLLSPQQIQKLTPLFEAEKRDTVGW